MDAYEHAALPPCYLLCRPPTSVPMQSHGLDQEENTTCSTSRKSLSQRPRRREGVNMTPPPKVFKYGMRVA
ncbi:hypothetical protein JOB18_020618 [Solea senegalensis]|uniref:Uncharacterized protein n=1 Tax=Solea senegalensis TaxID=28829 RepID=A0AAV6RB42_SOLSE|nr:hypothetical protein JOB18_020618 [Solea senegalensis]